MLWGMAKKPEDRNTRSLAEMRESVARLGRAASRVVLAERGSAGQRLQAVADRLNVGGPARRRMLRDRECTGKKGALVLLIGEPGSGRTDAAATLAETLGMPIYRVDGGRVVSKYIGETEKNLGALFDAAEKEGAILLFDEADALFGKRTDVKDAHDRYANQEVSYLLQRIETYPGLVILTTNRRDSIDSALLRRFTDIIAFDESDD